MSKYELKTATSAELLQELYERGNEGEIKNKIVYNATTNQLEFTFLAIEKVENANIITNEIIFFREVDVKCFAQARLNWENKYKEKEVKNKQEEVYNKIMEALSKDNPKMAEKIKEEKEKK